nr:SDR family NAD(P)-dependent oxidoreductase [Gordonia sp. NB41Y]
MICSGSTPTTRSPLTDSRRNDDRSRRTGRLGDRGRARTGPGPCPGARPGGCPCDRHRHRRSDRHDPVSAGYLRRAGGHRRRDRRRRAGKATTAVVDVRDADAVNELVGQVRTDHGRLDILVANAGICAFNPVDTMTTAQWDDMVATNLSGTFHCVRAVVSVMKQHRHGRIVGVSSGAGRGGMRDLSHYAATKWGIIGFIKSVALEVGAYGITANVVCPTTVDTPMVLNPASLKHFRPDLANPTADDARAIFAGLSPQGVPWLQPEEVTRAVMYLVDDPGNTTGSVIEVNLGTSASRA